MSLDLPEAAPLPQTEPWILGTSLFDRARSHCSDQSEARASRLRARPVLCIPDRSKAVDSRTLVRMLHFVAPQPRRFRRMYPSSHLAFHTLAIQVYNSSLAICMRPQCSDGSPGPAQLYSLENVCRRLKPFRDKCMLHCSTVLQLPSSRGGKRTNLVPQSLQNPPHYFHYKD